MAADLRGVVADPGIEYLPKSTPPFAAGKTHRASEVPQEDRYQLFVEFQLDNFRHARVQLCMKKLLIIEITVDRGAGRRRQQESCRR
jgi:hypothetical protein